MKTIVNHRLWSILACCVIAATFSSCASNQSRNRYSSPTSYSQQTERTIDRTHVRGKQRGGIFAAIFGKKQRDRRAREATVRATTTPARPVIPATQVDYSVLERATKSNTSVKIDISLQKIYLLVDGSVALNAPISSARPGKHTPRGTFTITEKVKTGKISTIYDVHMPNWMRLSGSEYGVHAGYLPGYPASAGCVRLPADAAAIIYDNVGYGTQVTISDTMLADTWRY